MSIPLKRIIAGIIDHCISLYIAVMSIYIITEGTCRVTAATVVMFLIVYLMTITFRDLVFKNASIGKKIMRLKITKKRSVSQSFTITFGCCLIRGLTSVFLMPIEIILLLSSGDRMGDSWSETVVISE